MAKWFVKFEETHVQIPNKLVADVRGAFRFFDGYLLPSDHSKDECMATVRQQVKELNAAHKRCKPVDTYEKEPIHNVCTYSISSYHVGSLVFLPVKKEVENE